MTSTVIYRADREVLYRATLNITTPAFTAWVRPYDGKLRTLDGKVINTNRERVFMEVTA